MELTWSDAASLLNKYLGQSVVAMLSPMGIGTSARVAGTLRLLEEEDGKFFLVVASGADSVISFCVTRTCVFLYVDSREATELIRGSSRLKFEGLLTVTDPKLRITLSIFEKKEPTG